MLSNYLWGNWGSDTGESRTVIGSDGKLQVVIRDEELKDLESNVKDPDELADRLLTQFPAYGTNSLVTAGQSEDWLLSEDDEDGSNVNTTTTTTNNNNNQSQNANIGTGMLMHPQFGASRLEPTGAGMISMSLPANSASKGRLPQLPITVMDWDYDEQFLWKSASKQLANGTKIGNNANDNNKNAGTGASNRNNQSDPLHRQQQLQNPRHQQQWIYGNNVNEPSTNNKGVLSENNSANGSQQYKGGHSDSAMQDFYNDRQHWMPDQLCKHCYACDTPFTVFRRRHHCRLCGQVFCASCAGYFVPSSSSTATLRTCQMCYEQVTQKGGLVHMDTADATSNGAANTSADANHAAGETGTERSEDDRRRTGSENESSPDQPRPMLPHISLSQQALVAKSAQTERASSLPSNSREELENSVANVDPNNEKNKTSSANLADKTLDTEEAKRHLGLTAASHLFKIGEELFTKEASLLWEELRKNADVDVQRERQIREKWTHKLMTLATRCCATVEPNVKKGDLLDIRPYCKLKVIPGGSYNDSAYLSGILFRKTVSHKRMAKEINNPKIMLLSGGIEFTRTENRIASLHTLLEQEGKYMEILVGRILKLKPDILMVGRSVSRKAQELLLKANVVLIQHVKNTLMIRISRQTGATVISSTDHIMNQFGIHVLGQCNRFRLVTFRDNDVWIDKGEAIDSDIPNESSARKSIEALLKNPGISNHERQAALAANMLGEHPLDGSESVRSGLLKRGVGVSFVMLEGCPKHLGCTIVLRGASRPALKQVKRVFRFLVSVAYNLRLETSYLKERCARIRPDYAVEPRHICSSSLCVDYGSPPNGRKVYPWNGGNNEASQRSISGEITAFHHQSILLTSVWMADKTQCCPAEVKGICYYSLQDVSLGQFLRDSCFNLSLKCQNPACKKSVIDHSLSFVHKDGLIKITVEQMDGPLPPAPSEGSRNADEMLEEDEDFFDNDSPIATWTYCKHCAKVVTPLVYISDNTWKFSFGKFLEVFFYNRDAIMNSTETKCRCNLQTGTILYFGCGRLAASFNYERVRPLNVFVRRNLPIDELFHKRDALLQLERISMASSSLFIRFDKHIDRVSREARSLFGSAANRPEHLQTVLSELNRIGSEVDHAAMTLQEKIASVSDKCRRGGDGLVNEALYRFPWFSRRYLFMLTSAWNERLSAAGQAIVAMKKLASSAALRGDSVIGPNGPITGTEELMEAMRRLRQLNEVYSRYNVTDITTVLPTIHGNNQQDPEYDDDFEDADVSIDFADGVDADVLASRRRLNNSKSLGLSNSRGQLHKSLGTQRSFDSSQGQQESVQAASVSSQPRVTPGGAVKSAITRFFNRGGRDVNPYVVDLGIFNEGRPRLEPGVNGHVVPVVDDQMSTVIAYSLSSAEYAKQFKSFSRMEYNGPDMDEVNPTPDPPSAAQLPSPSSQTASTVKSEAGSDEKKSIEQRMLVRNKSHIKHTFRDYDEKGLVTCKFVCQHYWATQFHAVRQAFLSPNTFGKKDAASAASEQSEMDVEQGYVQSLSSAYSWATSGGKSGASFARTVDDRFVIKCISRTELQMFLDCAPAYFEYLSKAFFHGLPTVLCKIVGVYQIGYHNRETGKRSMEQVAVMQNIFYSRKISKVFDLKGSLKGRFAAQKEESKPETPSAETAGSSRTGMPLSNAPDADQSHRLGDSFAPGSDRQSTEDSRATSKSSGTQLDGDFLEFTSGRPMPLNDRAKSLFHMSIQNDTLFLSIINVLDYSILIGIDEEKMELVVGIIDFMRQYDILKQMERVGKSLPMVVGSEAPTIIQPPLYKARFTNAMERYFMTVPCKWTAI